LEAVSVVDVEVSGLECSDEELVVGDEFGSCCRSGIGDYGTEVLRAKEVVYLVIIYFMTELSMKGGDVRRSMFEACVGKDEVVVEGKFGQDIAVGISGTMFLGKGSEVVFLLAILCSYSSIEVTSN
jgi:hypothetical protein